MKTIFNNNHTTSFDNFSFDVLTSQELASIKGGKEDDAYVHPNQRLTTLSVSSKRIH